MKKLLICLVIGMFLMSLVSINFVSAEVSYCCEKTINDAFCQNAPEEQCSTETNPLTKTPFRKAPTSCESTSYCKKGCCYISTEGNCMENTPERVCEEKNGVWEDNAQCDIPKCEPGCCVIGNQAAFVPSTRCKRLAATYGVGVNFRTDIGNEFECIASVTSEVKGACVFEQEFEQTCKFITQKACQDIQGNFHQDYLCSSEELTTICGRSKKTTCVEGKDDVYFLDTCGNLANIYDSRKVDDQSYWNKIVQRGNVTCGTTDGNKGSPSCGKCDYLLGSTCKEYSRGEDSSAPAYGDNLCRDLSCKWEGKDYQHGETWCANALGTKNNNPGSRYFRLVCYNGDVTKEPCADFRQETCIEDSIDTDNGKFRTAACRVNKWQNCLQQDEKKDCENEDRRDCEWVGGVDLGVYSGGSGVCVPKFAPGLNFWEEVEGEEGETESICGQATTTCEVTYEKELGGDKDCVENCECLTSTWQNNMDKVCRSIGDCGSDVNYIGVQGYEED
jgi:hypothetical protein